MKFLFLIALIIGNEDRTNPKMERNNAVENIVLFSEIYSYCRNFYPVNLDEECWNNILVTNVEKIAKSTSKKDLVLVLNTTFSNFLPKLRISSEPVVAFLNTNHTDSLFRWNHTGAGRYSVNKMYDSHPESVNSNRIVDMRDYLFSKKIADSLYISMPTVSTIDGFKSRSYCPRYDKSISNEYENICDLISAWSILRLFYPYDSILNIDWKNLLRELLVVGLERKESDPLALLILSLQDGHANIFFSNKKLKELPIKIEQYGKKYFISEISSVDLKRVKVGDEIILLDNTPIKKKLKKLAETVSGSKQWKTVEALEKVRFTSKDTVNVTIKRNRKEYSIKLESFYEALDFPKSLDSIQIFQDSVLYVDLSRIQNFESIIGYLPRKQKLIVDLRDRPACDYSFLSYFLSVKDTSTWMFPSKLSLRSEGVKREYSNIGWNLIPQKPYIGLETYFLIGGSSISYTESIIGYIENYSLGKTVGFYNSAGANGDVAIMKVPSGRAVLWSGVLVTDHLGKNRHVLGFHPTFYVKKPIKFCNLTEYLVSFVINLN